jgi:glycosyltransferase involved in cell wall biosynthesis
VNARFSASDLTVVIPAHNAAMTLANAVASIVAEHDPAPTVIVVDDRSADATSDVAASCGAIVLVASGTGPGAARNTGVRRVETEFLAFCDADDRWHENRLAEHLDVLTDPTIDLVLGRTRYHLDSADEDGTGVDLLAGHHFDSDDRSVVLPHFGAVTLRTAAFHRIGWIDENLVNYEDYEWFYRARDLGISMVNSDRIAHHRHVTASSSSRVNPPTPTDLIAVMQRSLLRRRELGITGAVAPISDLGR